MTEQELRSLIRQVVVEVLADVAPARPQPRNALVLFTGALLGFEASLESRAYAAAGSLVFEESNRRISIKGDVDAIAVIQPSP